MKSMFMAINYSKYETVLLSNYNIYYTTAQLFNVYYVHADVCLWVRLYKCGIEFIYMSKGVCVGM